MPRILIADDEVIERRALAFIMTERMRIEGLELDEAENGRAALELARARDYDLILMDVQMPLMDGIETATAMRAQGIDAPIVIVSAHDRFDYARSALRVGVAEYLLKPASAEDLAAAVQRGLEVSARNRAARELDRSERERDRERDRERIEYLRAALRLRLADGDLDPAPARAYVEACGLRDLPASVLALRFATCPGHGAADASPDTDRGTSQQAAARAALSAALGAAASFFSIQASRSVSAVRHRSACLILFHDFGDPTPEAVLGTLRIDLGAMIREPLLAGIVGPAAIGAGGGSLLPDLLRTAVRACDLAIPEFPTVRLDPDGLAAESSGDSPSSQPTGPRGVAGRAVRLIRERFSEDLSLEDVAQAIGASPSHLSRMMMRELGQGFSECVARVRVGKAKQLLDQGYSVKESSILVGYRDQAYFARVFRRVEGKSPGEYLAR